MLVWEVGILFGFICVDSNLKLDFKFELNRNWSELIENLKLPYVGCSQPIDPPSPFGPSSAREHHHLPLSDSTR
jgi:hypothetical protein